MEGSTLTQRRAECQLKDREIQTDYMMELGARLVLVRQIQREQEKEMKRIWFETRKMPSLIEENVRDVTKRPLTEFMAPCIDSLPPLAFTNRRPIPTMLHPPSPLVIRTQDAQRFIVFSYFVPAECPVSTEATADVSAGRREDLSTDTHLSSMLHRYLPHFFNNDSIPPQQTVEGTTEDSDSPVAISNIKEEDRFYPFSLPPLAQRFIGNSFKVPETSQPAVSATECRVATVDTADTATVKRENRWAATILPSVLPPCLPPVVDDDLMPPEHTVEESYVVSFATEATSGTATVDGMDRSAAKCPVPMLPPSLPRVFDDKLPGAAVEGTNKCPVASETTNDVSTHLKEDMGADQSPPDPAALPPSSPCICDSDHKLTKEEKEDVPESSLATEIAVGTSIVQGEDLDKSPAPRLPPSLSHVLDNDHKQPEETIEEATECSVAAEASVANREDPSAATGLPLVLPSSLQLVFDNDYKLPEEAVEGTSKCPVAREAVASVSTVLQEEFLAEKSPPAPTALSLRLPCTHNIDHKQPEETVENTTECSVDIEESAVASTVKREEMMGDKSPVHALPPSLACIHDKDHKQPDQKGRGTTVEVDICPHAQQLVSDANLTLATRNDELPNPLICVVTKMPVRVGASICRSEDEEPRPWTLEEAKDHWIGIEIESEERSVTEEVSPREGLKSEADCAHSKCSIGKVSTERAETILGRVGFLLMNQMQKIPFLKMEEKEKNKKLNKKLKDEEKERKEIKHKEEEQKKREKKEMKEREKEQKKVMKAEKKREKLEQKKREKERKEKEKAEKNRLEGLMKIHNDMMKDRIKKEKKCSEELKKREKAQAAFLEMERKIQEKEEKKREKMRREERKRGEEKKKREPAGGGTERVIEEQGRDESLKMDE
ncbi:microtubule-associated protein 9-like [Oncorhynchus mykiss]|uniref:microtubule-associated protein 9-like n=2 Tax=Oncorhynchus mykiss TaxID=8022 RepID=UPI00187883BB|nr:microtubule-associated protein 9-like [Oncorhynchus mykiss]XP_036808072.1 microtubule-associated protein 9-like [Oncorhynchus mykiss]XP_036808073.1 microtubule-associated protein 9-like [Oncorhynchus mykiss]